MKEITPSLNITQQETRDFIDSHKGFEMNYL
jgi:hypothetical protein